MKLLNSTKDNAIAKVEAILNELKAAPDNSSVSEVATEGLESLIGEIVTIYCACYIYTGKLVGVNIKCIKLVNAGIVYDTGAFEDKSWKAMEKLPNDWYIQMEMIESFGILK